MHPKLEPFELDPGERAALSLAVDVADAVVVIDDGPARAAAVALSIPVTGTLGVLLRAKELGLIGSVAGLFEQLEKRGFRIGPALLAQALAMAGESD